MIGNTTGLRPENQKFERQITTPEYHCSKFLYSYRVSQNGFNLVFLWHKGRNFRAITGDCRLDTPINFIRGFSVGKLDSFLLDFVSVSDERGSVITDYL